MTDMAYEPKRGDRVYDTRAERRGAVTPVHYAESLIGLAMAIEPEAGQLGGHWFSEPKCLRLMETVPGPTEGAS